MAKPLPLHAYDYLACLDWENEEMGHAMFKAVAKLLGTTTHRHLTIVFNPEVVYLITDYPKTNRKLKRCLTVCDEIWRTYN